MEVSFGLVENYTLQGMGLEELELRSLRDELLN